MLTLDNICCRSVIFFWFSFLTNKPVSLLDPCPRVLHVDVLPDLLCWEAFALTDFLLPVLHKIEKKKVLSSLISTVYWVIQKMNYRWPLPKVDNIHKMHALKSILKQSKNLTFITIFDSFCFICLFCVHLHIYYFVVILLNVFMF